MDNVTHLVDNIDNILDAAKKVKSAKTRYEKTSKKEQEAREAAVKFQQESNVITAAKEKCEDVSQYRPFKEVQRDLLSAHNKIDSFIDSSNEAMESIDRACEEMMALIEGRESEPEAIEESADPVEAMGDGVVVEHADNTEESERQEAVNA